jgi:hypothetical protein
MTKKALVAHCPTYSLLPMEKLSDNKESEKRKLVTVVAV